MDVPESFWEKFADWFGGFGNGASGFAVLAMILLTVIVCWCLPRMWKDFLEYRKSALELQPRIKELDLLLAERFERLADKGKIKIVTPKEKERKK